VSRPLGCATRTRLARFPSALLTAAVALGVVAPVQRVAADVLPPERRTVWNPGIPGGIPNLTTVCATVDAATYGNGTQDATAGIQAAIDACPAGQVVRLTAGNFRVDGAFPITIDKGVVLRGAGPSATKLRKTNAIANPLIVVGQRWVRHGANRYLIAQKRSRWSFTNTSTSPTSRNGSHPTDGFVISISSSCRLHPIGPVASSEPVQPNASQYASTILLSSVHNSAMPHP